MAVLTAKKRNALPGGEFALPGRRYPINDKAHAGNARARVSQYGTAAEKATVFRKTAKFFKGRTVMTGGR